MHATETHVDSFAMCESPLESTCALHKHREKYIYIYWKIKREETLIAIPPELAILIAMPQELAILIAILQELAMLTCRSNC
jgi:hypothetical protein